MLPSKQDGQLLEHVTQALREHQGDLSYKVALVMGVLFGEANSLGKPIEAHAICMAHEEYLKHKHGGKG